MKKSKFTRVLEKVAAQNGVDIFEVRREIELAINAGMENSDPVVRDKWKALSPNGHPPSPEELIAYLSKQANQKKF